MVTIVIIVHITPGDSTESLAMTETCLRTLKETATDQGYELLLIDNGSHPEKETQELLQRYGQKFLHFSDNKPISYCWNEAIKIADGDIIFCINNDVIFHKPLWLTEILSPFVSLPYIGVVGSRKISFECYDFIEGAFMAFKKTDALSIAENGQVFDEQFLFGYEDVDFCYRMIHAEKPLLAVPIEEMGYVTHLKHKSQQWVNNEGGWNGRPIHDVVNDGYQKLIDKYRRR